MYLEATPVVASYRHAALPGQSRPAGEQHMLKVIGGVVVYGFALFGLATYIEKLHNDCRD